MEPETTTVDFEIPTLPSSNLRKAVTQEVIATVVSVVILGAATAAWKFGVAKISERRAARKAQKNTTPAS